MKELFRIFKGSLFPALGIFLLLTLWEMTLSGAWNNIDQAIPIIVKFLKVSGFILIFLTLFLYLNNYSIKKGLIFGKLKNIPKSYLQEIELNTTDNLKIPVNKIIDSLKWEIDEGNDEKVKAFTGPSFKSFGEVIEINFMEGNKIFIKSSSFIKSTILDWGKNKRNVERFINKLRENNLINE